ncbi:4-hydroxythreonine-4-phosphate dehydrogenase PdxA [Curvibacter sp. CHRR-16]|uniref:4-hydroxythreonine-4-phosphate dehydrogenase PdxA n=1 Tax=Curvibacter sp. CHRR-16 TaxID=2835872 RepID=UPI001BDB5E65|nr:4-hydroxythreonine-4-phosphate dehydrogenase PdxA [Curvibacter sp. CHRR-16]MBT0569410.1 4-hydroxythreonine-4-phosphate dehydrogenase PdxA [Curvibacter sp. CHRR-16]
MGDAAGIGPEIIAQCFALHAADMRGSVVVGDVATMQRALAVHPATAQWHVQRVEQVGQALDMPTNTIAVLQVGDALPAVPWGQVHAAAGHSAGLFVEAAAQLALQGDVSAVVTAPLHKEALHLSSRYQNYPGHTELLQACAARFAGQAVEDMPVRMMLANPQLRVVLVTIHMGLRQALDAITTPHVLQTLQITRKALYAMLGREPRIAVAGVNPHAGEGGLFGREELDILLPAIVQARSEGAHVSDPIAPDTVFMRARSTAHKPGEFDVVVAQYHDQGLIPVKYDGVSDGVNVTLGLPLVRTSPDHGTAFDIAGQGLADPSSLWQAIAMARQLTSLTS